MKPEVHNPKILSNNLFPVIGIGASAGGLEAFKKFIKNIPEKSGMAFVLVQHLDPHHKSILPQLLQKVSSIPVVEITDDIEVKPDHIYIIPSNKTLKANDGVLELTKRPEGGKSEVHLPIDIFFESLAEIHRAHAIGVIMSGNASDGTKGISAIKNAGGLTFAQDMESAANESMPRNAIASGMVDYVLPPEEILKKLLQITKFPFPGNTNIPHEEDPEDEVLYNEILSIIRSRKDIDFAHYKQSTIRRRIAKRISEKKLFNVRSYKNLLAHNLAEQDALYQDMLIPVTGFFRDQAVFDVLCQSVFPYILKNKKEADPIRMWVAGCSTGQEAISMAICLTEFLGESKEKIHVFATDISEQAITTARKACYTEAEIEGISKERLDRFFTKQDGKYYVNKDLRDKCIFAVHDFLTDAPFGKLDFISCRNVLIYMDPKLQKRALTTFHYSLNPKGYLLLGLSESVSAAPDLFDVADKANKLFTRNAVAGNFMHVARQRQSKTAGADGSGESNVKHSDFHKKADEVLLAMHMPSGVIVNEGFDIVEYRGSTSVFLEAPSGKPSHNLLKIARKGLAFELRTLIQKAKKENKAVKKTDILLDVYEGKKLVTVEAVPLQEMAEVYFLVLFTDQGMVRTAPNRDNEVSADRIELNEQHILQLETELAHNREDMRVVTAEQETANEELQTANEELLSANEELQSLNEELETSKEELQSTNEELSSLNDQINTAREYSEAIVDAMREPVVVLDSELRIRTANKSFYSTFRLTKKEAENTQIYQLGNKQWDIPGLRTLLEEVMPRQRSFDGFEVRHTFPGLGERIMLLNAREMVQGKDKEKLLLLAIEDVTEHAHRLLRKKELLTRFQNLVVQAPVAMCILKGENHVVEVANDYYLKLVGRDKSIVDVPLFESMPELITQGIKEILDGVLETGEPYYGYEQEVSLNRVDLGREARSYFNWVYQPIRELDQSISGIIIVVAEVTDQVIARKRMEVQAEMAKNLIMTAPGFVCTLAGPQHIYTLVNSRYQELFGKRQIQGKPIMEALPELKGQEFDKVLDRVYKTGIPYVGFDIPITLARDEGLVPELRYFNFSYQPMYNENNEIYSILVFGYEVTEQMNVKNRILEIQTLHAEELEDKVLERTMELSEANYQLLLKNEQLKKVNNELESFNYVSSHDLQEPLRKIQMFSSFIMNDAGSKLSDKGKASVKGLVEATVRMRTLINDLLAYSMADISERKFEMTELGNLMQQIQLEFDEVLSEKKVTLDVGPLCTVSVNRSQFRQLFSNLISNSIKYSKADVPLRIEIRSGDATSQEMSRLMAAKKISYLPQDRSYCCITVSDNGIGFDPAYNEKIFEVFQRLHNREEYYGNGIGLAIVKKIVENHNGLIIADGKPGEGAKFRIYLPAKNV